VVDLIHRSFLLPSCKVDLSRYHPRPCLQYYIKRCLGPCVEGLTTPPDYRQAVRDAQMFLEGRQTELSRSLEERMEQAASSEQFEVAARYRDLLITLNQVQERQRMATTDGDDADVYGYHHENGMVAVNLFHMRGGKIVDRREFCPSTRLSSTPRSCRSKKTRRTSRNSRRMGHPSTLLSFSPPC
jgi:excinuclease ABC subunit C